MKAIEVKSKLKGKQIALALPVYLYYLSSVSYKLPINLTLIAMLSPIKNDNEINNLASYEVLMVNWDKTQIPPEAHICSIKGERYM